MSKESIASFGDLSRTAVSALLTTVQVGRSLALYESTESTNDDARNAAGAGCPDGHVVVADTQTRGRGSRGRVWSSPAGSDLYFSLVARLSLPPISLPPLTLVVGLAVAEALDAVLPSSARALIKWPNDVWVDGKKLVGVLVESASVGERLEPVVIGIGINVNRTSFPSDLDSALASPRAGFDVPPSSLALELGGPVERSRVLSSVLNRLEQRLHQFAKEGPGDAVAAINQRLALRGERARCGDLVGEVAGVSSSGALMLRTDEAGLVECVAGTLRLAQ
ncbi:MAG: Biotin-protein ligase [Myxococcaceae bacterium]|nr:Biotin-protein ligase [Myxococcaceae bacterium]